MEKKKNGWVVRACVRSCVRELRSIPSALNYHSSTVCVYVFKSCELSYVCVCGCRVNSSPTTPPYGGSSTHHGIPLSLCLARPPRSLPHQQSFGDL